MISLIWRDEHVTYFDNMESPRIVQQFKNMYHFVQAHLWRCWYGFPDKSLLLYGVTGTNGKTTTSHLLAAIFAAEVGQEHIGMLTTINVRIGTQETVNETKMTTLPSKSVYRYLHEMKQAGVTHVVLEITSHALDQHRLAGLCLEGAIITNIEREHLNYHRTMEEYAAAKMRILTYLKPGAPFIYKADDEWVKKSVNLRTNTYPKVRFVPFTAKEAQTVTTPLGGSVNKENALSASRLAAAVKISSASIAKGIASVTHVPGRMEEVPNTKHIKVIIDYAVTPAALNALYKDMRATTSGKIYAVLGAAGLRDRGKRADMARIVKQYADMLILTREDPWTENEEQIFQDLEKGVVGVRGWKRIIDRREAIEYALSHVTAGDTVVITGKGAETGMGVGKDIIPWSDKKVVLDALRKLA